MAEVEGIKKQVTALSGPGGKALLRLAVARALVAQAPRFVLLNSASGDKGLDLSRVDTNDLLRQAGIFAGVNEGLKERTQPKEPLVTTLPPKVKE